VTLLGQIVTKAGYTFFGTTSGSECLSLLSRIEPRLILLDVRCRTWTASRPAVISVRIRGSPAFQSPSSPRSRRPADVRAGMAAGGNDFILMPLNPEVLLNRVNHWTSQRLTKL
jgi:two-component system, OmpR family, response regulator